MQAYRSCIKAWGEAPVFEKATGGFEHEDATTAHRISAAETVTAPMTHPQTNAAWLSVTLVTTVANPRCGRCGRWAT